MRIREYVLGDTKTVLVRIFIYLTEKRSLIRTVAASLIQLFTVPNFMSVGDELPIHTIVVVLVLLLCSMQRLSCFCTRWRTISEGAGNRG